MPFLNVDGSEQDPRIDGWNDTYPKPFLTRTATQGGHKVWHGVWERLGGAGGWRRQITHVMLTPWDARVTGFYSLLDHEDREVWSWFRPPRLERARVEQAFKTRQPAGTRQPYMLAWAAARLGLWMNPGGLDRIQIKDADSQIQDVTEVWEFLHDVLP